MMENNIKEIKKQQVEEQLGCDITNEQFEKGLEYAARKQAYIYELERRAVVLQPWYLVQLTVEYVRSLAYSKFTMDLCRTLRNMEKEHLFDEQGTPMDNHIVTVSAL